MILFVFFLNLNTPRTIFISLSIHALMHMHSCVHKPCNTFCLYICFCFCIYPWHMLVQKKKKIHGICKINQTVELDFAFLSIFRFETDYYECWNFVYLVPSYKFKISCWYLMFLVTLSKVWSSCRQYKINLNYSFTFICFSKTKGSGLWKQIGCKPKNYQKIDKLLPIGLKHIMT